ncbi:MAG: efflux RND transporter periplasmic adaptor subunit [Thermoanaerobaculia bacterium]|jgi:HlyD family secretion protein
MRRIFLTALTLLLLASCKGTDDPNLISASGYVEATDVRLSAKIAGRVESVAVAEGDAIAKGAVVAKIEPVDLELALRQARAEREVADAELRLRVKGARDEDIREMEAQLRSAESDLAGAQRDYDRFEALLDRGSGTTKSRDDAKTRRDTLKARVDAINQSLARLRSGFRSEEKDASRARLAGVDARIAQLEQQIADATIVSPIDGVVTEKLAEPGELLSPGGPVAVVTNLADAWLNVYISEPDLPRVRLGMEAVVNTDDGQSRKGKIIYIASKAEFTPKNVQTRDERAKLVFKLKIGLDNKDGLFKPGMPAQMNMYALQEATK